jgi:hypothetical protein
MCFDGIEQAKTLSHVAFRKWNATPRKLGIVRRKCGGYQQDFGRFTPGTQTTGGSDIKS